MYLTSFLCICQISLCIVKCNCTHAVVLSKGALAKESQFRYDSYQVKKEKVYKKEESTATLFFSKLMT